MQATIKTKAGGAVRTRTAFRYVVLYERIDRASAHSLSVKVAYRTDSRGRALKRRAREAALASRERLVALQAFHVYDTVDKAFVS